MRTIFLVMFALSANQTKALPLSEVFVRQVSLAHTREEVEDLLEKKNTLDVLNLSCRMELQREVHPLNCYEAIRLQKNLGLITSQRIKQLTVELDQRCRQATQRLKLGGSRPSDAVSPLCRQQWSEAKMIEDYRRPRGPKIE